MSSVVHANRICFISSRSGFVTGSGLMMDWANGRLIRELSEKIDGIFSVAVFSDPSQNSNYNFPIHAHKIYALPFPFSYAGGIKNIVKIKRILKHIERENDLLIIQLPFIGFPALRALKKPTVFHVCANVLTAAQNPFKYKGLSRLLSRAYALLIHHVNKNLFKKQNSRLIVNGNELGEVYRQFKPVPVVSSSIYSAEMISEEGINTRQEQADFVMLFIGRPSKEKGFHTLIAAFISLVDEGKLVILKLLGVKREELETILGKKIDKRYTERMEFWGFISWGEQFRDIVRSSHCMVVSSVSEGTPRVLIEARALGCPVVATNIGGIVTSVTDQVDGILINPGRSEEVSTAVARLFDENMRMRLARNGLNTAKKYTLENFVKNFTEAVRALSR